MVLNLIPVFGVASAVIFLGEGMTGRDALGAVLIGSPVLYFAIADHREATAQAIRPVDNPSFLKLSAPLTVAVAGDDPDAAAGLPPRAEPGG